MIFWLYKNKKSADRLDAEVSRAKNWPKGGTHNWSNPTKISENLKNNLYYVPSPPSDVIEKVEKKCPPDIKGKRENGKIKSHGETITEKIKESLKLEFNMIKSYLNLVEKDE